MLPTEQSLIKHVAVGSGLAAFIKNQADAEMQSQLAAWIKGQTQEAQQRAEAEQKAKEEAQQRAEEAQQRAEEAQQRAEAEQKAKEEAQQRAEAEQKAKEEAEEKVEKLQKSVKNIVRDGLPPLGPQIGTFSPPAPNKLHSEATFVQKTFKLIAGLKLDDSKPAGIWSISQRPVDMAYGAEASLQVSHRAQQRVLISVARYRLW